MQLSKTQITVLLTEVASQEDGFHELLRMSFEAMMKAERQDYLTQAAGDKGNGFRQVQAYGRARCWNFAFLAPAMAIVIRC
jgi:predicted Zn-dependent protease